MFSSQMGRESEMGKPSLNVKGPFLIFGCGGKTLGSCFLLKKHTQVYPGLMGKWPYEQWEVSTSPFSALDQQSWLVGIMLLFAQLDPLVWEKENVMIREVGDQAELGTRRGSVNSVELMNKDAGGNLCPGAAWHRAAAVNSSQLLSPLSILSPWCSMTAPQTSPGAFTASPDP